MGEGGSVVFEERRKRMGVEKREKDREEVMERVANLGECVINREK